MGPLKGLTEAEARQLIVLGTAAFVLASTYSSINVALPAVQEEFDISLSALKWVTIIGAIMVASLSLSFGRIGDLVGRQRVYKLGIIVYTVGSGLTALSMTFPQLMAFRVFMAIGLAMSNPLAGAIIAATVAPERRGQAIGIFASFQAAGMLTGPSFGGLLLDLSGWRAIFVAYLAIGLVLCIAQQFFLRGTEERRQEPFDYAGAVLLVIAYPSLLIALSLGPGEGWASPITLAWFAVAAVGLAGFVVRELRFDKPIFHFRFFRSPAFCIAMFTLIVASFVQNPITLFAPLYLQKVLSVDALTVGLVMMALPISTLIAGPIGGSLADKHDPRLVAAGGVALTLFAVIVYAGLGVDSSLLPVVVALVLIGLGGSLFRPANQVAVYRQTEQRDYGALAAMLVLLQSLAGTLGTTIAVAVNETRTTGDDPGSFVEAQRFTFAALVPLLLLSLVISVLGRGRATKPSTRAVTSSPEAETP